MSIEINLLPWRDWRRERRQRRWRVMLLCALLLGVATGYGAERYYASVLDAQRQRHASSSVMPRRYAPLSWPPSVSAGASRTWSSARRRCKSTSTGVRRSWTSSMGWPARVDGVRYSALEQREALLVLRARPTAIGGSPRNSRPWRRPLSLQRPPCRKWSFSGGWRFRLSVVLANWGERSI